jgi:DNA replication protein DnaC
MESYLMDSQIKKLEVLGPVNFMREMLQRQERDAKILKSFDFACVICGSGPLHERSYLLCNWFRLNDATFERSLSAPSVNDDGTVNPGCTLCQNPQCRQEYVKRNVSYRKLMNHITGTDEEGYLIEEPIVPKFFYGRTLDDWNTSGESLETYQQMMLWLEHQQPGWLFCGTVGTRKTSLACALAFELRRREKTVSFIEGPDLKMHLDAINRSYRVDDQEKFYRNILRYDVLIFDDLMAVDWKQNAAFNLFNKLYNHNKLLIITANQKPDELETTLDQRIASRLMDLCVVKCFTGDDWRKKTTKHE